MTASFWGLVIEPERLYSQVVPAAFKVSMVSLGPAEETTAGNGNVVSTTPKKSMRSTLMVRIDGKDDYAICSLEAGNREQQPVDLVFAEGENIALRVAGDQPLHLTGYYLPSEEDHMGGLDDGEEDIEEDEYDSDYDSDLEDDESDSGLEMDSEDEIDSEDEVDSEDEIDSEDFDSDEEERVREITEAAPSKKNAPKVESEEESDVSYEPSDDEEDKPASKRAAPPASAAVAPKKAKETPVKENVEAKKGEAKKDEAKKDEVKKDEAKKDEAKKDEAKKGEVKKGEASKSEAKKGEANKSEANKSEAKTASPAEKKAPGTKVVSLPSGVTYEDVKVGAGAKVQDGSRIGVYYKGLLQSNGKMFDTNHKKALLWFTVGKGEVIKGLELGVIGMAQNGERLISIPAKLGYGPKGAPPQIPGNANLVFEIKADKVQASTNASSGKRK